MPRRTVKRTPEPAIRDARSNGVTRLYKFRPYRTPIERKRLHQMLLSGEVYFAPPSMFNDPFECRPLLVASSPAQARRYEETLARKRGIKSFKPVLTPAQLAEYVTGKSRDEWKHVYRILCLSASGHDILQWGHYADGHRGVMVHFDATKTPIADMIEVQYRDEYPEIEFYGHSRPILQLG